MREYVHAGSVGCEPEVATHANLAPSMRDRLDGCGQLARLGEICQSLGETVAGTFQPWYVLIVRTVIRSGEIGRAHV